MSQAASAVIRAHPRKFDSSSVPVPIAIIMQAFPSSLGIKAMSFSQLGNAFIRMQILKDFVLYNVGELANTLYIVEEGELGLKLETRNFTAIVETLMPGTMAGSLEFFAGQSHTCTLVALSDSVIWKLDRENFEELSKTSPEMMLNFVTRIAAPFDSVRNYNTLYHCWSQLQ